MRVTLSIDGATTDNRLRPDTVDVSLLFDLLSRYRTVLLAASGTEDSPPRLSLVGVKEGSCAAVLDIDAELDDAASHLAHAIETRDFEAVPRAAHVKLHELSTDLIRAGLILSLVGESAIGARPGWSATVSAAAPIPDPPPEPTKPFLRGETTLFAHVEGVRCGQRRSRIWIRPENARKAIEAKVTETLAMEVAELINQVVGLRGIATWDGLTNQLVAFQAQELTPYRQRPLKDAIARLRSSVAGRLDHVDPIKLMHELRGE